MPAPAISNGPSGEVLTLSEAAAYLRLAEAEVLRFVDEQALPARRLGNEWRFLKAAIEDWLRLGPPPKPSKEAQLAVIGSWKNDSYLEEELKEIYQRRGRPSIKDES
ncbi:MAG: helix-turn-helix domain-containing protein [Gemmataceae bacterium]